MPSLALHLVQALDDHEGLLAADRLLAGGRGLGRGIALVEGAVRILRAMGVTYEAGRWRERALMPTGR